MELESVLKKSSITKHEEITRCCLREFYCKHSALCQRATLSLTCSRSLPVADFVTGFFDVTHNESERKCDVIWRSKCSDCWRIYEAINIRRNTLWNLNQFVFSLRQRPTETKYACAAWQNAFRGVKLAKSRSVVANYDRMTFRISLVHSYPV